MGLEKSETIMVKVTMLYDAYFGKIKDSPPMLVTTVLLYTFKKY